MTTAAPAPDHVLSGYQEYLTCIQDRIAQAMTCSSTVAGISQAADLITDSLRRDRAVYAFGASHAGLMVQDLFYRAGGLVPIQPILTGSLMLDERPITRTSALERLPGLAHAILMGIPMRQNDVLILVSVSGRNILTVEMCAEAQERGVKVIAVTSLDYANSVTPRANRRLHELADVVIDIPGRVGDAAVDVGDGVYAGPTSSAVGAAILHGLCVEVAVSLQRQGVPAPVYRSANTDGGDEHNAELISRYGDQLTYFN